MPTVETHPFEPAIPEGAKKLIVGTLPPSTAPYYFSNSSNTRLWDFLVAIHNNDQMIGKGGNLLKTADKVNILTNLGLGLCDIILKYKRVNQNSTKDDDIIPLEYQPIIQIALDNKIEELIFVYESALKWFIHSITNKTPVMLRQIRARYNVGEQEGIVLKEEKLKIILIPSPLNRGRKGETQIYKLDLYRKILNQQ